MDQIQLENDVEKQPKQDMPVYVSAIFIFLAGVSFLFLTVYYIAFLPIPPSMQPLRVRILTFLQLEKAKGNNRVMVILTNNKEVKLFSEPSKQADVIYTISNQGLYKEVEKRDEWVKIELKDSSTTGWIEKKNIDKITN